MAQVKQIDIEYIFQKQTGRKLKKEIKMIVLDVTRIAGKNLEGK